MGLKAAAAQSQKKSPTIVPTGTMLETEFKIIQWIGSTNFAELYAVDRVHCSNSDTVAYEARFYVFEDLGSSINAYRARSIRRISQRAVLRTTWQGLHVVVYRSGTLENCSESAGIAAQKQNSEGLPEETSTSPEISNTPITKTKIKTARQRESLRLRQQSRRERIRMQRSRQEFRQRKQ